MRSAFYFVLLESFLGILYLVFFGIGYFADNKDYFLIGGIGMTLYIVVITFEESKKLSSFLFTAGLVSIITAFFSNWYKGLFWVSAITTIGQIPGLLVLIFNYNKFFEDSSIHSKVTYHLLSLLLLSAPLLGKFFFL